MSIAAVNKSANNSWFVLILVTLTFALVVIPISGMSVLFKEISQDLNLSVVQIGSVWGMISFGSIFILPVGGILCDRLGAKRAIVILGLLSGLTGALRGLSESFLSLMATTFLWGILSSAIVPAFNMIASQYSSHQRQGLAQGFSAAGSGLGLTVGSLISASLLSPVLGGWRHVFFLYGGVTILFSLLWQFGVKELGRIIPADSEEVIPLRQAFTHLFRLKALWLIGLAMLAYQGCVTGMQGFLPYHLENNGWTTITASGALAAFTAVGTIGVIPLAILSDRIGSRKIPLLAACLSAAIGVGLLSITHGGILWILVIMAGLLTNLSTALFTTVCIETKGVGIAYSGTAIGIILSLAFIGKSFAPPLGNSLADIGTIIDWPFIFWADLAAVSAVILIFIRETGWRSKGKGITKS